MIPKRNIKLIKDQYKKYFGEVNEFGQKDGYRIEYSDNSTCYVGQFKNGKRCGFGTYTSNYYSYVGEFYDDDYEGYVEYIPPRMEKCMKNMEEHGIGKYKMFNLYYEG